MEIKIDRKDVYRVEVGAVTYVNCYGTKVETRHLNTYFCVAVRNASNKIITFNELKTGKPLVKRVYMDEIHDDEDDYEDMYYPYAYDDSVEIQNGDVEVNIDQNYETDELQKYVQYGKDGVAESIDTLDMRAIEQTCAGYDLSQTMEYYNKKLYLCPLGDDFIIVSARFNPFGAIVGFRELITGRKVIKRKRVSDDFNEEDFLIDRKLKNPEITLIDCSKLATRELTVAEFESYMALTPEEVEAKISNYLAKLSKERGLNYNHKIN